MPDANTAPVREFETSLASALKSFAGSLTALRDFVVLVGSLLTERQKELIKVHEKEAALLVLAVNSLSQEPTLSDEEIAVLKGGANPDVSVSRDEAGNIKLVLPDKETGERVLRFVKGIESDSGHQGLLYRSALISLISSAEWFLSQLFRQYFGSFENAMGVKDKVLSFQDLQALGSIEEAKAYLVDTRIDEIMRGSFDDWLKYLRETIKLSASYLNPHKNQLTEIFQRRNVMVHNNGSVNSIYLNKVSSGLRTDVALGMKLSVEPEYLEKSIDLVERNFLLLGAELWKQLDPKENERGSVIVDITFERMSQEHWDIAEGLSLFLRNDRQLAESYQMIGLLNYWQCIKWQGRFKEIQEEVAQADFSAKDELYQLARYALLDDIASFMGGVPDAIRSGKLTTEKLKTWPIFREVRKADVVAKFIADHEAEAALPDKVEEHNPA